MKPARKQCSLARRRAAAAAAALALAPIVLLGGAASAGTLDRVRETGTLRLGYSADARPFAYRDANGTPAGYAVALCQRIADAVKQRIGPANVRNEFVPVGFAERFAAVADGRIDVLCDAATPTLSRRAQVSFSIPIFSGGVGAMMRKDAPARMRAILAGQPEPYRPRWRASLGQILEKRVFAVRADTTTQKWLDEKIAEFDIIATVETIDDYATGVARVVDREVDVLWGDRATLLAAVQGSASSGDLMVLDRRFTAEPLSLAVGRSDEDMRLLVDRALSELYRSGSVSEVYLSYFGPPDADTRRFFESTALPE